MTRLPSAVRGSVLAVALAACLAACSSGGSSPTGSAAAPSATPSASPSATPSATVTVTVTESQPSVPVSTSTPPTPTPSRSGGITKVDEVTGRLSPVGKESVVVDTSDGPHEVHLTADTVVLDTQGSVCDKGAVPHRCTSEQLVKALKAGVTFEAKVLITDGDAVKIEEIVRD
ncbi:hypothetical protein [Streptosporangium saharense]|uniref:DUF5666 domain-containing protein n=1 Tax=Streptosporangium saharense TaxID=1706840 RepID=A0A7W7VKY0_9ACTN|nr:hypothetical protein [Streptosporangium saharense]MBB4913844.1 hypothetical protein [Streptosporangium saharense]